MKIYFLLVFVVISMQGISQSSNFVELDDQAERKERWRHLEGILKSNRIVALGENLHGVKEYNATKLELIQYLHEELGYNVLAIESDVAKNYIGNLYKSIVPDTVLLKYLFTPPWHTEEHLEIVKYLKSQPDLRIIGFDVEEKFPLRNIAEQLNIEIDTTSSEIALFKKSYADWKEVNGRYRVQMGERDSTMAQVAKWIIDELYENEKVIISAHNTHISNTELLGACMGELLKEEYGDEYYSIGFFHSLGSAKSVRRKVIYKNTEALLPVNSIQSKFLQYEQTKLFINIKDQDPKGNWLFREHDNILQIDKYKFKMNLAESFDGLIWIKEVSYPKYIIPNKYLD